MTVSYTGEVASCRGLGCFWKLLFRWRGSIYKLLWQNLILYSGLYFGLSLTYRFLLDENQRTFFEKMSLHCQVYGDLIPVSFVLGFYVSLVIKRWWDQYLCLPWPDNLALFVSSLVHGQDDRGRMMRRTIMRYVNLSLLLTLRMISPGVKKRFPTLDHTVEAGWMLPGEKKIFDDLDQKTLHAKYWMPLVWAGGVITRAKKENRIKDDFGLKTLIDEVNMFRSGCGGMLNYDWISIPLVYTQVVTLAVYVFFLATLMGNQYLDPRKGYPKHEIDLVFPVFTFLQFFFYMGWLKVAESLVNPFGEDDDDFELNWLLDRNLQISYVIVDEMHQEHPEMLKDQYWDEVFPAELPYTAATKQYQTGPPLHSAEPVVVSSQEAEFMPLDVIQEDHSDDSEDTNDPYIDVETDPSAMRRGETHPMKIRRRPRCISLNPSESSRSGSFSGGKRNSVINILSRMFHPPGYSRDEIHRVTSSTSFRSRNIPLCDSTSQSIGPSHCSFHPDLLYPESDGHDEMFCMSDLDLVTRSMVEVNVNRRGSFPWIRQQTAKSTSPIFLSKNQLNVRGDVSPRETKDESSQQAEISVDRMQSENDLHVVTVQPSQSESLPVCGSTYAVNDQERRPAGLTELEPIFEHRDEATLEVRGLKPVEYTCRSTDCIGQHSHNLM